MPTRYYDSWKTTPPDFYDTDEEENETGECRDCDKEWPVEELQSHKVRSKSGPFVHDYYDGCPDCKENES